MKETYTAIIPVREGSQRLKNKNILPFGESNLLIHKIRQLKQVSSIDSIVVSSDSDIMLEMADKEGVKTHKRALEYSDDKTRSFNEVVENVVLGAEGDHILWTPCVCPMLDSINFENAIKTYKNEVVSNDYYDSLISVKLVKEYFWDEEKPLNYTMEHHVISQQLPNWYSVTNGLYMAPRQLMLERKYFCGYTPFLFEVNKIAAIDIDDEYDLEMARAIYNYQNKNL